MTLWNWLVTGSAEQTMSKHWMRNKMPEHDAWTRNQQLPGMALIVSDTNAMERKQFWARLAAQKPRVVRDNIARWKVSQK